MKEELWESFPPRRDGATRGMRADGESREQQQQWRRRRGWRWRRRRRCGGSRGRSRAGGGRGGGVMVSFIHPSILSCCLLPQLGIITHDAAPLPLILIPLCYSSHPVYVCLSWTFSCTLLCCTGHYVALLVLFIGAAFLLSTLNKMTP